MIDRLVCIVWRALLVLLIVALGLTSMDFIYRGLLDALAGNLAPATQPLLGGALLALLVFLLCKYRGDIVYG
jgi:hypothetical protein